MVRRVVIFAQLFAHASISHAHDVARGKVDQPGMLAMAEKLQNVIHGVDVGGERIAQVGIEIRETRAVCDHVHRLLQPRLRFRVQAQARLAGIAFHHFHFVLQEGRQAGSVPLVQGVEGRRLLHNFLEAALRGRGAVAPDEQRDFADVGNFFQQVHQPDFADEAGHADQHDVFPGQCLAHV